MIVMKICEKKKEFNVLSNNTKYFFIDIILFLFKNITIIIYYTEWTLSKKL